MDPSKWHQMYKCYWVLQEYLSHSSVSQCMSFHFDLVYSFRQRVYVGLSRCQILSTDFDHRSPWVAAIGVSSIVRLRQWFHAWHTRWVFPYCESKPDGESNLVTKVSVHAGKLFWFKRLHTLDAFAGTTFDACVLVSWYRQIEPIVRVRVSVSNQIVRRSFRMGLKPFIIRRA